MIDSCARAARIVDSIGSSATAEALGVPVDRLLRWCSSVERPTSQEAARLSDLAAVISRAKLLGGTRQVVVSWMVSANPQLDGMRPVEVFAARGRVPVLEALDL